MADREHTRNFSIIAHIDHGKSTLADRLIQACGAVTDREFQNQLLDNLYLERERGITIKSQAITLPYLAKNGQEYELNLIDTPGHVDFTYEVSRALASCEGVLLIVDASQGVEAQTLANMYLAMEHDLTIVPVINKIDLISADVDATRLQITEDLGLDGDEALAVSAKEGTNIDQVLEAIVNKLPPPKGQAEAPLQALIFDAQYDPYRGTVIFVRVMEGQLKQGDFIRFMHNGSSYRVEEVGLFKLRREPAKALRAGQVGYVIAGVKTVSDVDVGDTITNNDHPAPAPLPGFREAKPVVFSSIYPVATDDYPELAEAIEKLKLNDASLTYQKDYSQALGTGFRCGFLGLLHLEVVQERLEREFGLSLILTAPSVRYQVYLNDGQHLEIENPALFPDPSTIDYCEEPYVKASILMPDRYIGTVMQLCLDRRGEGNVMHYPSPGRVELISELPLAEVIYDFYDKLKTVTQGYGSFDYEFIGDRRTELAKLDILVNGERVDALSMLVFRGGARPRALHAVNKLAETIPRQQFKIAIQGAIGGTIIARSTINAFRKDVTAKCYGGDVSRKRKLLEKQKAGKKRMKLVGNVPIPQKAFLAVLQSDTDK
ncbi:GTP-binding protein LepA [Desulfarculus baarsii DSM 2075]|uniref:Elongation factor 4 n=1 Tax=Desulfarculus baarsii (strain ATCC 33931 / DSM 2075 / LMG 7858 / VKM B-1802 / 2st14) TaxID=644282 RepID=E1QK80_DESB2|nr:translation elongation factor 4 [Desulfarculus baarsii]ADK85973.1 GTP-binding protein LepA [Desulfarculus baarsii DSM 2075]